MRINVYKNGEIEKSYESDVHVVTVGVCEDILQAIDIDKLIGGKLTDEAMSIEILKVIVKSFDKFKPMIQNIFPISDEEYSRVAITDVSRVVMELVNYTISNLFNIGGDDDSKN